MCSGAGCASHDLYSRITLRLHCCYGFLFAFQKLDDDQQRLDGGTRIAVAGGNRLIDPVLKSVRRRKLVRFRHASLLPFDTRSYVRPACFSSPLFAFCSMPVETLGEAWSSGWRVHVRCALGLRADMKSIRECHYRRELDLETIVCTRGRDFPLALWHCA